MKQSLVLQKKAEDVAIAEKVVGTTVQERLSCTLLFNLYEQESNQEERA